MISEVYDAFRAEGVPEERAVRAAEVLSDESLATKSDIASLKIDNAALKWMVSFNLAFTMAILWKIFS